MIFGTSLSYTAVHGKQLHIEEGKIMWESEEKISILIRKASSHIIFHYSPFSLYCFKYSLDIKKLQKI